MTSIALYFFGSRLLYCTTWTYWKIVCVASLKQACSCTCIPCLHIHVVKDRAASMYYFWFGDSHISVILAHHGLRGMCTCSIFYYMNKVIDHVDCCPWVLPLQAIQRCLPWRAAAVCRHHRVRQSMLERHLHVRAGAHNPWFILPWLSV